jgi:hypothetical protein
MNLLIKRGGRIFAVALEVFSVANVIVHSGAVESLLDLGCSTLVVIMWWWLLPQ